MYFTLFFTLLFARRLSIHTILLGDTCYVGSETRIKHLENQLGRSFILHPPDYQCQSLLEIGEFYRYGNWCGKNYGGFNGDCKQLCLQNISNPTDECIKCNQPIDWVDQQCMYHDFCVERFQEFGIGHGTSCDGSFTLGNPFPSPCSCPQNITYHLKFNMLALFCNMNEECLINGALIHDVFDSDLFDCSCSYQQCNNNTIDGDGRPIQIDEPLKCWNATACVSVDQCTALGGQ
ncbi:hypothetical protein pb186bvf_000719 [Paramecium bursaria]